MTTVRRPAVAGVFYPDSPAQLQVQVRRLLDDEGRPDLPAGLRALIVPHAGYRFSGPTAARAYAVAEQVRDRFRRVAVFGPSHRVPLDGLALPSCESFATPLGQVRVEHPDDLPAQVVINDEAHAEEHSIEVQLPFLKTVLDEFTLVPFAVGRADPLQVAEVIAAVSRDPQTLIVISTDLSHYLPYDEARRADDTTVRSILTVTGPLAPRQACGAAPTSGMLVHAAAHRWRPRLLHLCNSGDTPSGNRSRVVGYASFTLDAPGG